MSARVLDRQAARKTMRRLLRGRYFPDFTDASSRHVRMMADGLLSKHGYPMFQEEPDHCAYSLVVTVEQLWKARKEIARLKKLLEESGI